MALYLQGIAGILIYLALAWLLSEKKREVRPRIIITGLLVQICLILLLLYVPLIQSAFATLSSGIQSVSLATEKGTAFVFGYVGGGPTPFDTTNPANNFIFAFRVLPLVLMIGALSALLWHWRILAWLVRGAAVLMQKAFRVGGAVGIASAANIFMGMAESPLLIGPYIPKLSRSELFVVMSVGMSTIAGSIMVLVATLIEPTFPGAFGHLLIASVINAPAAIMIAKIMVPGDLSFESRNVSLESHYSGALDAITKGTGNALRLVANIVALLIVFVSLIELVNMILALVTVGDEPLTLSLILGTLMAPFAWLMGIPWSDAAEAGALLGTKVVINEIVAYMQLGNLGAGEISLHSRYILTYALCSFGNLGSLAIMIGTLSTLAPERRREIIELGPRTIVSAFIATAISGAMVGLIAAP
ncbi:NupC/NupG family nucleoside CNT transporter [Emcibacter sp.]|uniref:NupC/NupG family nucleoside CNT transporter n=1 Tax=Emcibacter sp. TaxID=1979954 RepID=UPI003A91F48B